MVPQRDSAAAAAAAASARGNVRQEPPEPQLRRRKFDGGGRPPGFQAAGTGEAAAGVAGEEEELPAKPRAPTLPTTTGARRRPPSPREAWLRRKLFRRALAGGSADAAVSTLLLVSCLHPDASPLALFFLEPGRAERPLRSRLISLLAGLLTSRLAAGTLGLVAPVPAGESVAPSVRQMRAAGSLQARLKKNLKATWGAAIVSICSTAIFHVFIVLFGAPLFDHALLTCLLASYVALLGVFPAAYAMGANRLVWIRLFAEFQPARISQEHLFYLPSLMTVGGTWAGAMLIPLDWDRPWQVWPLPCLYGAFVGHAVGTLLAIIYFGYHALTTSIEAPAYTSEAAESSRNH